MCTTSGMACSNSLSLTSHRAHTHSQMSPLKIENFSNLNSPATTHRKVVVLVERPSRRWRPPRKAVKNHRVRVCSTQGGKPPGRSLANRPRLARALARVVCHGRRVGTGRPRGLQVWCHRAVDLQQQVRRGLQLREVGGLHHLLVVCEDEGEALGLELRRVAVVAVCRLDDVAHRLHADQLAEGKPAEELEIREHVLVREGEHLHGVLGVHADGPAVDELEHVAEDARGYLADTHAPHMAVAALAGHGRGLGHAGGEHGLEGLASRRQDAPVREDGLALHVEGHVRRLLVAEQARKRPERVLVERQAVDHLAAAEGREGAPPHKGALRGLVHERGARERPPPLVCRPLQRCVQPELVLTAHGQAPALSHAPGHRYAVGEHLLLCDESERVEPRGAPVPVAQGAGADVRGAVAAEGDALLLELAVHVEVDLFVVPVKGQVDAVPGEGLVRDGSEGGAPGAEEAHVAVLSELELGHPAVHLVGLPEDKVPGV
mmetsp:Transcript_25486/g.85440  ORF Transcript_25486/g.85440 Transcript_25486/m.85440 type:complete len:490 (+) Transcript_25486:48-1517(+)